MAQMVDSTQQKLPSDEIVKIAAENTRSQYPFKQVYLFFVSELGMEGAKGYRFGNTIFIVHPNKERPDVGIFRALNADTAENFVENGKQFIDQAYEDGFKVLSTEFSDESILNIFKIIGREQTELQNPNMGYKVGKTANGNIRVDIMVGKRMVA